MNIVWSPTALDDLAHLRANIAQHDPRAAARMGRTILDAVEGLTESPAMGRPGRLPGTRELVVAGTPFVIPYTVREDALEIVAVLHGARKWPG